MSAKEKTGLVFNYLIIFLMVVLLIALTILLIRLEMSIRNLIQSVIALNQSPNQKLTENDEKPNDDDFTQNSTTSSKAGRKGTLKYITDKQSKPSTIPSPGPKLTNTSQSQQKL